MKYKHSQTPMMKIATNLAMSVLVLSVGALALAPLEDEITVKGETTEIYRSAGENGTGVSLMFNVYWGTEEVYRILDILSENQAHATFFIGGCWADDNIDCLREIFARGHEIGNHGYFHKDHKKISFQQNREEIANCNRFIELVIGEKPTLFAPPSGAYGNDMITACNAMGMTMILWSKDTVDWRDKDRKVIYERATTNVRKGDFILMHPMSETVSALNDILLYYKNNGLETVSVSDNLQEKG
jgi:peptidoglycan/xylan/chitin deacetylase (PgdA/CDA1 family)